MESRKPGLEGGDFSRDSEGKKWTQRKTEMLGELVAGPGDALYVISPEGLWRGSAKHFGRIEQVFDGQPQYFINSKMGIDRTRPAQEGWISVIAQEGTTVTVVDYWIGNPSKN